MGVAAALRHTVDARVCVWRAAQLAGDAVGVGDEADGTGPDGSGRAAGSAAGRVGGRSVLGG